MSSMPSDSFVLTEEPDLVIGHFIGHVTADAMARIIEIQGAFSEGKSGIFLIANVHRLKNATPEARRIAAEGPRGKGAVAHILGAAVVGASFHARILGTMVFRASSLLHRGAPFPIRFFGTEEEARAWFDELRGARGAPGDRPQPG